jgi:hypothetical protein
MIHYSVWFNLRDGVHESEGLDIVQAFLRQQCNTAAIAGFHLLKS